MPGSAAVERWSPAGRAPGDHRASDRGVVGKELREAVPAHCAAHRTAWGAAAASQNTHSPLYPMAKPKLAWDCVGAAP